MPSSHERNHIIGHIAYQQAVLINLMLPQQLSTEA